MKMGEAVVEVTQVAKLEKMVVEMVSVETAIIEMAAASGIELLDTSERNPWLTSTYGTGQIIVDALNNYNCKMLPRFDNGYDYIQSQIRGTA